MPNIVQDQDVTVVELGAEYRGLDDPSGLIAKLLEAASAAEPAKMVLDLTATKYFDSQFVEVMIRTWKRLGERNGEMVLCGLSPFCADVIRILKLDTIWPTYETRAEAVAALAAE